MLASDVMPMSRQLVPPNAERLLVVMSDIEMGAGGLADDFPHSDFLGDVIAGYADGPYAELPVDLVFNGDTFDLLKTGYLGGHPRHITRDVAIGKLTRICAVHPRFFEALRFFLGHRNADRRVVFVIGNHDAELFFPDVQELIQSLCGERERILFPGLAHRVGGVWIEHGSQYDPLFRVDPARPFVEYQGQEVLNISWGAAALLDTVMELQPLLHFHERLKPKELVFELMPEIRELLVNIFWSYWTRDYWQGYFKSRDPTKKLSWRMVREAASRLISKDPEVAVEPVLQTRLKQEDDVALYLLGHMHQIAAWSYGDRKLMQTGCLRNEYMVADAGKTVRPIAKSYAEVFMRSDWPIVSNFVELEPPPPPKGYVPDSIFSVLPKLQKLLAEEPRTEKEQAAQLAKEARDEP